MLKCARMSPEFGLGLVVCIIIAAFIFGLPMSGASVFFILLAFYITLHHAIADNLDKADIASLNGRKSIPDLRQWESERPAICTVCDKPLLTRHTLRDHLQRRLM